MSPKGFVSGVGIGCSFSISVTEVIFDCVYFR